MSNRIRVLSYGLGPIGASCARVVLDRAELEWVGAVDIDPKKIGSDAGSLIGIGREQGFPVRAGLADALRDKTADVVLHSTSSFFGSFMQQIKEILAMGLDIVSTSEELSFPWLEHPEIATEIDELARKKGVTVLATGVNPGFLMDFLPLSLSGICQHIEYMSVERAINASTRRLPFQKKIGCGMMVDEFYAAIAEGHIGHVGLVQSAGMLMDTLGRSVVKYELTSEPIVASRKTVVAGTTIDAGKVKGLRQTLCAQDVDGAFLSLVFEAAIDLEDEKDIVRFRGNPNLEVTLRGTNGDIATAAIVVNAIRRVFESDPGLLTMRDLPVVTWFSPG